ncbi:exonuclease domain-containing protein [Clostridium aestuarii]|uniref:Exonuclease domain-containing protein n=1 Tax=Clostridium aestuarii TaxID=338193 RepID=A0ABT4CZ81_9CLOT|nr:3'-5' exonuclease [Clostridium aestuarii]MCY6484288.1 exonuclease domain-containing protein [Clostridium aestuarii]
MSFYLIEEDEFIFVPYNLLAIDFEFTTTRFIKNKARKYIQEIVEIGVIYKNDDITKEYTSIIKPRYFTEYKNKNKHNVCAGSFSYGDIEKGIDLSTMFEKIKNMYVKEETIWVSWGKAEYDILKMLCKIYGITLPFLKEDYMDLSLEFRKFYNIKQNISLDKALSLLNIPIIDRHRALPDARALMNIINKMLVQGYVLKEG